MRRVSLTRPFRMFVCSASAMLVSACAATSVTQTSANTALISTSAAPACGAQGAAKVASEMAAIETIRAGFDRYVISGGEAANNVHVYQAPGSYHTSGTLNYGGGFGTYNGTTTYTPGATIPYGSHDQSFTIVMFRAGDAGYEDAVDARQVLGPKWPELVKNGVHTCT